MIIQKEIYFQKSHKSAQYYKPEGKCALSLQWAKDSCLVEWLKLGNYLNTLSLPSTQINSISDSYPFVWQVFLNMTQAEESRGTVTLSKFILFC